MKVAAQPVPEGIERQALDLIRLPDKEMERISGLILQFLQKRVNACIPQLCRALCEAIEQANRLCRFAWGELPFAELQLYNLRHVQEHGAQLHLFLGQQAGKSARWESRAE